jgi:Domain of unknown function (DUF222)
MARLAMNRSSLRALEAERVEIVAQLLRHPDLVPLPARSGRGRSRVRDLSVEDLVVEEVRTFLCLSAVDADRLVDSTVMLTTRLPRTWAALRAGDLDFKRASMICGHVRKVTDHHYRQARRRGLSPVEAEAVAAETGARIEDMILGRAPSMMPHEILKAVIGAVIVVDPQFAADERKRAHRGRYVSHRTNPGEGTGDLFAHLPAAEALAMYTALDGYARQFRDAGDPRSLDELRADVLMSFFFDKLNRPQATDRDADGNRNGDTVGDGGGRDTSPDMSDSDGTRGDSDTDDSRHANIGGTETDAWGDDTPEGPTGARTTAAGECPTCGHHPATGGTSSEAAFGLGPHAHDTRGARGMWQQFPRPAGTGLKAHVLVTIDYATLRRLNDDPAELAGHGPIDADYARALAFSPDSTWRRLVIDPVHGQLLDYGRTTYRPPAALDDHVRARDHTCRTPGCTVPATRCDLDHVVAYPAGATADTNLGAKCRHDHRLKHEGRWRHEVSTDPCHPPHTIVLTSPTGRQYVTHAHTFIRPGGSQSHRATDRVERDPWRRSSDGRTPDGSRPDTDEIPF